MDANVIYDAIYKYFGNYEYKLFNSFVYAWECDFFASSKSGYDMEVEVKVSRSDFFKDFQKDKHKLFADHFAKKTHHITKYRYHSDGPENLVCEFIYALITFEFTGEEQHSRYRPFDWRQGRKNGTPGFWVNDHGHAYIRKVIERVYAPHTNIRITALRDILCPHYFYYAVPENMVKIEEVPKYAGLIFVDEQGNSKLIRKAPFLHKFKMDMRGVLLHKFHCLWKYSYRSVLEQRKAAVEAFEGQE